MSELSNTPLQVCHKDSPPVPTKDTGELLGQLPDWQIKNIDKVQQLVKVYTFKNFVEALAFTNRVGELAEQENHHPSLLVEWGKVTVTWWTHLISGLHKNDFIMAARCDELYS